MTIRPEQALRAKALAVSAITALIGTRWSAEFVITKDIKYPLVVCTVAKAQPLAHLGGPSGFTTDSVDVAVWGDTHDSVEAVAAQLRIALHATKGDVTVGSDTAKMTCMLTEQDPCTTSPIDGSEFPIFGITQHYTVSLAQAVS
jgi:hypothetical protein